MIYCRSNHYKFKNLISKISKQLEQMSKMSKQLEQITKTSEKDMEDMSKQLKQIDETNVSENEKKVLYEKLKQMSEDYDKALPKISKQLEQLRERKVPEQLLEMSEQVKQKSANVTKEETQRSEIRESKRKRLFFVEDTAISKAMGIDKILKDKRGRKSIAISDEYETHAHELDGNSPGNELKELKDLTDDVKISEQETSIITDTASANVTQEEMRPEIGEGESERFMYVEETPISKMFGADKISIDRQGRKSIAIRTKNTGVHTHGTDGKAPVNEPKELEEESTGK
ncbi:uncharacterized protein LOC127153235 [Labeo rohita]|uniref:uncharacterized protein LOC127153235 n=1 Tax=Labeo rohita TaxID=84645 RepID=UPI0021E291E7|nr:uncharacterized protein LOC127153235 [Labeo rohita]